MCRRQLGRIEELATPRSGSIVSRGGGAVVAQP
jgi:hypothetical protein